MKRARLAVALLGAAFAQACGGEATPPSARASTTVVETTPSARTTTSDAATPLPSIPSTTPTVEAVPTQEPGLPAELQRLPAVSADGAKIAVLATYSDGARGDPKSELLVLDTRTDRALSKVVVDDPKAFDEAYAAARPGRLGEAAKALHGETWIPLVKLSTAPDPSAPQGTIVPTPLLASNARAVIQFVEPTLTITFDAKTALRREQRGWSDIPRKGCKECDVCPAARALLDSAAIDESKRVVLLVVRYWSGSETCWERDESYHAVSF